MAITISGQNNNDKIIASDGVLDSISGFNVVGVMTAAQFDVTGKTTIGHLNIGSNIQIGNAGIITATTLVGNVQGNINHTSNLLLQIGGSEKFRVGTSGQLGIGGANYGTSGQVLTSGGSGSAATWSTITGTTINNNANNRVITGSGTANTLEGEANLTFDGAELDLNNSGGSARLYLVSGNSADSSIYFGRQNDGATGGIRYEHTNDSLQFMGYNNSERLRIDSSGRLLIGTTTEGHPNANNLTIAGSTNSGITLRSANDSFSAIYFSDATSGTAEYEGAIVYGHSDNTLRFGTNHDTWLEINSSGNVTPYQDSTNDLGENAKRWRNLYADTLYGDGSNLTGVSGVTINNNADNRIITGSGTANTLNGESGLTFDGTNLVMSTDAGRVLLTRNFGEAGILIGSGNAGGATLYLDGDSNGDWSGGDYAYIRHATNGHLQIVSTNPSDNGEIQFYTGSNTYYGAITADGRLSLNGLGNTRAIEINAGSGGGSIVIDRNGNITSLIRASDGGSNIGGGSGGGSRISLGKTQMHFKTYPYVSNVGDAVTYTTRASIDTSGNFVPGANASYNLGTTSLRWANLYVNDLQLSNEAKKDEGGNDVDGTWGDWTLQEGEHKIYMINNRTGKRYSLKMEEE